MKYDLNIGSTYNFHLLAASVLGNTYTNATLVGILDFDSAMLVSDVATLHTSVYSMLNAGTPRAAQDLLYVKIKTTSGEYRVFAMDWLAGQPELVVTKTVSVVIHDIDLSTLSVLRAALVSNGFNSFDIQTN